MRFLPRFPPAEFSHGLESGNIAIFSPDGRKIVIGGKRGMVIVDARTLTEIQFIEWDNDVFLLAVSSNGCYLAAGSQKKISVWQFTESGLIKEEDLVGGHTQYELRSLVFSPEDDYLAIGGGHGVTLFNVGSWKDQTQVTTNSGPSILDRGPAIAFHPNGKWLAHVLPHTLDFYKLGANTNKPQVSEEVYGSFDNYFILNIMFSSNRNRAFTVDTLHKFREWNLEKMDDEIPNLKESPAFRIIPMSEKKHSGLSEESQIINAVINPESESILSYSENNIAQLWEIVRSSDKSTRLEARKYFIHNDLIRSGFFSHDDRYILTLSGEKAMI